jgi:hypothetical protein
MGDNFPVTGEASRNPPYVCPSVAPTAGSPAVGASCSTNRSSHTTSTTDSLGSVKTKRTSDSKLALIDHHLLLLLGGGTEKTCDGSMPIDVSSITIEGEFSPSHSIWQSVGAEPNAGGDPQTSTEQSLTASNTLVVVVAEVAT